MRVTKKSGYGLVAMTELAENFGDTYISTKKISEKYELPRPFLEKIMQELKEAELVEVKRGRGGGYELAEKPKEISVKSVISVLEESKLAPVNCLLPDEDDPCPLKDNCPTLEAWEAIYEKFLDILRSFTLADLLIYLEEDNPG
ncbi:Rrf2 family transcriptional regulator [Candidatus Bipolaricaulota bacterium]|nr:Rrf2 family transcriptional regulator [Candidatus Bipolaricaulota bacterium]